MKSQIEKKEGGIVELLIIIYSNIFPKKIMGLLIGGLMIRLCQELGGVL